MSTRYFYIYSWVETDLSQVEYVLDITFSGSGDIEKR